MSSEEETELIKLEIDVSELDTDKSLQPADNIEPNIKTKNETQNKCKLCSQNFENQSKLRKHVYLHLGQSLFICNICEEKFLESSELTSHIRQTHVGKNNKILHRCKICAENFRSPEKLKTHVKSHKPGLAADKSPNDCDICGKSFRHSYHLKKHAETHRKKVPAIFPCETASCKKTFFTYNNLQIHRKNFNHNPFPCHVCGNTFATSYDLEEHVLLDHPEEKPHKCDTCSEGFSQFRDLRIHKTTHPEEPSFILGI